MRNLICIALLVPFCQSINDWQPVFHRGDIFDGSKGLYSLESSYPSLVAQNYKQPSSLHAGGNQCELYKVGFIQDLYFQYIQFKTKIPEMKEFTLCFWTKFTNHSNDHPLFSYAVDGQPRAIYSWVSNTDRSSYFSLSVEGHTFYRLNYPLRLNRWYHACQSWNGKTGEWQIWVNAERVGRGFHNRLVGHVIPSNGIAISGQEQTQYGGGFLEGKDAPKGSGGMLGEITMLQLYHVALTAGKAHRDHKHHHAHEFDHYGRPITTTPRPPPVSRPTLPTHPLLTAGQINPNIALNIASGQASQAPTSQIIPGQDFNVQFLNGQFTNTLVSQQLMNGAQSRTPQQFTGQPPQGRQIRFPIDQLQLQPQLQQLQTQQIIPQQMQFLQAVQPQNLGSPLISSGLLHPSLVNPANVQFIDNTQLETHQLFKRHNKNDTEIPDDIEPTDPEQTTVLPQFGEKVATKQKSKTDGKDNKHKKRELVLHNVSLLDDGLLSGGFDQSLLDGLAGIGQNQPILQQQKQADEREPAEAEVTAVMNICSSCEEEPFQKALVIGWRGVPKKLYSGSFFTPATPKCRQF